MIFSVGSMEAAKETKFGTEVA